MAGRESGAQGSEYWEQKANMEIERLKALDKGFQPQTPQNAETARTFRALDKLLNPRGPKKRI